MPVQSIAPRIIIAPPIRGITPRIVNPETIIQKKGVIYEVLTHLGKNSYVVQTIKWIVTGSITALLAIGFFGTLFLLYKLYDWLFTEFPAYHPDRYPLSKGLYTALESSFNQKHPQLNGVELSQWEGNYFKSSFADELQDASQSYQKTLKENTIVDDRSKDILICPITGQPIIFPVKASHLGWESCVYEAAAYYFWVEKTGKDFSHPNIAVTTDCINIDGEKFKKIHPVLSKKYENGFSKIARFVKPIIEHISR